MENFILDDDDLSKIASNISITDLKELVKRYQSQGEYFESLVTLRKKLQDSLADHLIKKDYLHQEVNGLESQIRKFQSNRQVYHEVESIDKSLSTYEKENNNWKVKHFHPNLNIEKLREAVPRLLTKITKIEHHKVPTLDLQEYLDKLEDELNKLLKQTTLLLSKYESEEDGDCSNDDDEGKSLHQSNYNEYSKLQNMIGYSAVHAKIYYNLMTAGSYSTDNIKNVRISMDPSSHQSTQRNLPAVAIAASGHFKRNFISTTVSPDKLSNTDTEECLDSSTIKAISRLLENKNKQLLYGKSN